MSCYHERPPANCDGEWCRESTDDCSEFRDDRCAEAGECGLRCEGPDCPSYEPMEASNER